MDSPPLEIVDSTTATFPIFRFRTRNVEMLFSDECCKKNWKSK